MSDPVIARVNELRAKGFDLSKLPEDVKLYLQQTSQGIDISADQIPDENAPVVQEQHPSISFADRFKIKNVGDDAMSSIAYLKSKPGNENVDFDYRDGQIIAKTRGEKEWKVLDPSGPDLQDITDVAYDTIGSVGQGVATAGAALAGGAFGAGFGAIPAAMAAGGATGLGIEAARQKLGAWAGVHPEEFDKTNLAISGGIGMAAPLAFGTGAAKSAIADSLKGFSQKGIKDLALKGGLFVSKDAVPDALAKETALSVLEKANKGVLANPASKLGSFLSGIPRRILEKMHENVSPEVKTFLSKAYEGIDPEKGLTHLQAAEIVQAQKPGEMANQFVSTINEAVQSKREEVGAKIGEAVSKSKVQFDVKSIRQPIEEYISSIKKTGTGASDEIAAAAENAFYKFFTKRVTVLDEFGNPVEKIMAIKSMDGKTAMQLKDMLSDFVKPMRDNSSDALGKNNSRLIAAFQDAERKLSNQIYDKVENGQALRKMYRDNEELSRGLASKFGSPEAALKTMKNIDNKSYTLVKENLDKFDKMHGTKLGDLNDVVQTWNIFANADATTKFGRGSEIARRAMGAGGLLAGGLAQAAGLPISAVGPIGMAGGVAGQVLTSPAAIKVLAKPGAIPGALLNTKAGAVTQNVINKLSQTAPAKVVLPAIRGGQKANSAWMLMNNRGEK